MNISRDDKLFAVYLNMRDIMWDATGRLDTAELLFWYTTYGLLAQSRIAEKNDALGIIMNHFTGTNNGCNEVYHAVTASTPDYEHFNGEFALSDRLWELGDHWKATLACEHSDRIRNLRRWLQMYTNVCMPAINGIIKECEDEWKDLSHNQLTETDLKARQRAFSASKRRLKSLLSKLDTAEDLIELRHQRPDFHPGRN